MKKYCTLLVVLVLGLALLLTGCHNTTSSDYTPASALSSWLMNVKDDTPISKIALPGTHDSGTFGMMSLAETQGANISDHLKMGARYFDIRVKGTKNGGQIFHGPISGKDFVPIVDDILAFIKANPSEFLVLDFQHFADGSESNVVKILEEKGVLDIAVTKSDNDISDIDFISNLRLQDVRGKVLIFFGNDLAFEHNNIFRRNNDSCTLENASLDSLYIGDLHKKGSEYFISDAMPKYFEHILKVKKGMLVLQGQLTAPSLAVSPRSLETKHDANMSQFVRNIKDNKDRLDAVNIIMRDFFEDNAEKALSTMSLNYYKGNIKEDIVADFKALTNIK